MGDHLKMTATGRVAHAEIMKWVGKGPSALLADGLLEVRNALTAVTGIRLDSSCAHIDNPCIFGRASRHESSIKGGCRCYRQGQRA